MIVFYRLSELELMAVVAQAEDVVMAIAAAMAASRATLGCLQSLDWTGLDYWTLPKIESLSIYQHIQCICAINKWCL